MCERWNLRRPSEWIHVQLCIRIHGNTMSNRLLSLFQKYLSNAIHMRSQARTELANRPSSCYSICLATSVQPCCWAWQHGTVNRPLTLVSHVEVVCPGTWRLGLLTPNAGSKSTPKACSTRSQATNPACHT